MNHIKPKKEFKFQPAQVLAISFLVTIFIGTFLLLLPISTNKGNISFIDALFTATSATCVTGLIVVDTPNYFSLFGQIVILTLFQLGGLGIMTFTTLFLLARGKRISIRDRFRVQEDFHHSPVDVKSLIRDIFIFTFTFEFIGTILLFIRWNKNFPFGKALYISLFHSISAFCNAGFSLFSDSLTQYKDEWLINLVFFFLIICGGLGFLVLREIKNYFFNFKRRKKIKISLHTKLVLIMTLTLILVGACFFFIMENNSALKALSWHGKIFASFFQVITPRTAGFNTIDLTTLNKATILFLIGLMFIGASPGSTGGGVKTTTVGVIFFFLKSKIIGRESVNLFYRTLPQEVITKAFTVVSLALGIIFLSSFALFIVESSVSFENALFEVFSAFGTVGLSLGTTSHLSNLGKVFIIITMYVGRIGPLTLLYALGREKAKGKFEYIEEKVMIG